MRAGKVRRLTFSRAIADLCARKNPDHEIWLLDLVTGTEATEGSTNCLFGVADRRRPNRLLRVAVTWAEASYLANDSSRMAVECKSVRAQLLEPAQITP